MLNLKKTAVAVLAFGSSAVFAGTMGPVCTPGNVTVPCENTGWAVGIQALYLKPSYSNDLAWLGDVTSATGTTATLVENDPDWSWGFKLEAAYLFGTGNDLNLNWYHLGGKSTTTTFTTDSALVFGSVDTNSVTIKPRWDAVNLEFGQHVDFGEFKNIRFHGGVQYARINTPVTSVTTSTAGGVVTAVGNEGYTARYTGFGPRVGADMSYDLGNGLAMYGNAATAVLAGTSKFSSASASTVVGLPTTTFSASGSRTAIVPEVEAKLGLMYTYAMAQGDLSLDVGYMWVNYFNALQADSVFEAGDSDFGVQGPYIGLKWVGTVV
ncbi:MULTISPECIES: Lpg1974 family pore-forming outer membrane protein [Legionella]|uniref:Major outer membrane protein n=1 Tax=Legionella septentrionalis TaxID=2498109 RepID=A0A3S0VBY3_9GAMM|nr:MULTISPECIES: Lpg1974 family pore-forming outer membrane protein [Legionella]MCP0914773.1 Lpg1974 family pore-forming outer membrane protein [Legionella sp. 27cVA30]RUQ91128.1 hypothetical protein EKM59_01010 [Legionella septentrionalis]RUR02983.1 hypothetical protein ELY11_00335 [Legionella septentrionalis]RUR11582.1 hypothetical protein ELY14_01445 [Legionella septentrionalis]RUR15142.1 hypothetical protein ELY10_06535 [Legionella septentrionalis]